MQDYLIAVTVRLIRKLAKPRQDEFVELFRATDDIQLGAKIIPEEEGIYQATCPGIETCIRLIVERAYAIRNRMHHIGVGIHLHHVVLHPE